MFGNDKIQKFHPLKGLVMVVIFLGFVAAASYVVMFLWNTILTDVTNVKPLNFWQAAGLLFLAKILFGGFGGRGKGKWKKRKEWRNKWMNMSHEERHEAKTRWKEHCEKKKRNNDEL